MIEVYSWGTPNGKKIPIMLEEVGLPYRLTKVDIGKGEQKSPEFLALNPNGKIPAMIDPEGASGEPIKIFESGAILMYLAEKSGKLLPKDPTGKYAVIEWLMFQMSAVGPMFGQLGAFLRAPDKSQPAITKFRAEVERIYGVLDAQLGRHNFLAHDYSIADIATFTWAAAHGRLEIDIGNYPHVGAWLARIASRPAVEKGLAVFA